MNAPVPQPILPHLTPSQPTYPIPSYSIPSQPIPSRPPPRLGGAFARTSSAARHAGAEHSELPRLDPRLREREQRKVRRHARTNSNAVLLHTFSLKFTRFYLLPAIILQYRLLRHRYSNALFDIFQRNCGSAGHQGSVQLQGCDL